MKNIDVNEIESELEVLRREGEKLEKQIYGKRENQQIGERIRRQRGLDDSPEREADNLEDSGNFAK